MAARGAAMNRTRAVAKASLPAPVAKVAAKVGQVATAVAASAVLVSGQAQAASLTFKEQQGLTYMQIKGTGLANTCPLLDDASDKVDVPAGDYQIEKFCLEPTGIEVREEAGGDFTPTKLMTRLTYTLDEISGKFKIGGGNSVSFQEEDGIDYAATTVQLPGGERVPFLFSVKDLNASGNLESFTGNFNVPSYRGSSFLDPKGRGGSTGYETASGIIAADQDALETENVKSTAVLKGNIVLNTAKVNNETGEIAGVFESVQPSDTDLGAKAPKDVKISGIWYGRLTK